MVDRRWNWRTVTVLLIAIVFFLSLSAGNTAFAIQGEGEAVAAQAETTIADQGINILSLLMRGGWFMIPLVALSLVVLAIGFERLLSLRRGRIFPDRFVRQLSRLASSPGGLEPRAAYDVCQKNPSVVANVFKSLLVKVGRPQSELENAVSESSQRQTTRMLQMVSWLSLAAAIAPLIGLLGTVWGITQAFYDTTQLVAGQNRAEALAEGIYTALVTTMCGLIIAIPSAVMAHYFENRVVSLMNQIEEMIFNLLPQLEKYEGKIRFSDVRQATEEDEPRQEVASPVVNEPVSSPADGGSRRRRRSKPRVSK